MNDKFPAENGKRYLSQNDYLRKRFGGKVMKVSLNGGFTCPNRDGTKGVGGCIYCSESGSGDFAGNPSMSVTEQFEAVRAPLMKKWRDCSLFIPYFQAGTNTYAPLPRLKALFEEALSLENVCGLAVSTRPDCISEETADYLAEISRRTYLTVELGLQTVHDKTAALINRCHTYADFLNGFEMLHSRGINVCVHLINGLPFESREMMLETVRRVSELPVHSIKLHLLHIIRGTRLADMYERGEFPAMELDEYVSLICDQLELIPPDVIIQRLTGDGAKDDLIAPLWSLKKFCVLNEIDKEMRRRDSFQGKFSLKN
ncbi:MAG: TIGR01212 family radical SAM protein [Oscillospiraceae bacterium]|nr:TIGR01212 family radical SAM protein [Oscillospiraceae bacterium]